jgi:hypothetical protein
MQTRSRTFGLKRGEIAFPMDARELLVRGRGRLVVLEVAVEPGADEAVADGVQAVRALRVVRTHVVQKEGRMGDVRCGHDVCFQEVGAGS